MRQPSEAEILRAAMEAAVKTVMTSLPGKVVSYDPATKLATIEPMVHNGNPIPPIPDVPIKWPRFGGYRLVGPLDAGDEVTLHFHKWDPSRFRVSGELSQSNVTRDAGIYAYAVPGSESSTDTYNGGGDALLHLGTDNAVTEIKVSSNAITLKAATVNLTADAPSDAAARASLTDQQFTTLKSAIAAGFNAIVGLAGPATIGAAGAAAFNTAFNPTSVASTKVKLS